MSSRHLHEEWRVIVYDNINGYQSTPSVWCMWSSFCLNSLIYFATSTLIYQFSAAQWSLNAGERGGGDSFNCEIIHNQYVLFIHIRPHLPLAWIYVSTWTAVPPHPDIRSWTYFPVPGYLPVSLVQAMCWQESDFSHHSIVEWKTFEIKSVKRLIVYDSLCDTNVEIVSLWQLLLLLINIWQVLLSSSMFNIQHHLHHDCHNMRADITWNQEIVWPQYSCIF